MGDTTTKCSRAVRPGSECWHEDFARLEKRSVYEKAVAVTPVLRWNWHSCVLGSQESKVKVLKVSETFKTESGGNVRSQEYPRKRQVEEPL